MQDLSCGHQASRTGQCLPCWCHHQHDCRDVPCLRSKPAVSWKAPEQEKCGWLKEIICASDWSEGGGLTCPKNIWHQSFYHERFLFNKQDCEGLKRSNTPPCWIQKGLIFHFSISLETGEWLFIAILEEIAPLWPVLLRASPALPHEMAITAFVSHPIASANCKTD